MNQRRPWPGVDEDAFGIITWVILGVSGIIVLAGAGVGIAYAADAPIEATVVDKQCGGGGGDGGGGLTPFQGGDTVSVQTKLFNIDHTVEVSREVCLAVNKGNFVEYYVRSERTVLFETEGGKCLYDSAGDASCIYG